MAKKTKKPASSKRGSKMVPVAKKLSVQIGFGGSLSQDRFIKILESCDRIPPKDCCIENWRNQERYRLNRLGVNDDLLEAHELKPFQLDSTGANQLELRKPADSLLMYEQLKRTTESAMSASERVTGLAKYLESGDKRLAIFRNVNKLVASITAANVVNEKKRQELLS